MAFLSQWPSFDLVPRFDTDMPSTKPSPGFSSDLDKEQIWAVFLYFLTSQPCPEGLLSPLSNRMKSIFSVQPLCLGRCESASCSEWPLGSLPWSVRIHIFYGMPRVEQAWGFYPQRGGDSRRPTLWVWIQPLF